MKTLQSFSLSMTIGIILSFSIISNLSAQGEEGLIKQQRINIAPLTYSYELPVGDMKTIQFEGGFSYGFAASATFGSNGSSSEFVYAVSPIAEITYRGYTKLKTETNKGKPLQANSGNYFFGQLAGSVGPIATNLNVPTGVGVSLGGGWGFQRVYMNNFVWNFGIGLGFVANSSVETGIPIGFVGDGGIGILIGK